MDAPLDQAQERAREERLEAIARLAGGIAHDLNNLLTPIVAYSNLLSMELKDGTTAREFANEISAAGDRMVEMTQLLQSLRAKAGATQRVDAVETLRVAAQRIRSEIPNAPPFIEQCEPVPAIRFEPNQLESVLVAILRNAVQATAGGGRIFLSVSPAPDAMIRIAIRDEGCGMTDDVQAHLFEPYFTTRPKGEGKGLGLALARAAIYRSGGHMRVRSEPGKGTEMELFLRADAG